MNKKTLSIVFLLFWASLSVGFANEKTDDVLFPENKTAPEAYRVVRTYELFSCWEKDNQMGATLSVRVHMEYGGTARVQVYNHEPDLPYPEYQLKGQSLGTVYVEDFGTGFAAKKAFLERLKLKGFYHESSEQEMVLRISPLSPVVESGDKFNGYVIEQLSSNFVNPANSFDGYLCISEDDPGYEVDLKTGQLGAAG